jgi:hypothetical protein
MARQLAEMAARIERVERQMESQRADTARQLAENASKRTKLARKIEDMGWQVDTLARGLGCDFGCDFVRPQRPDRAERQPAVNS